MTEKLNPRIKKLWLESLRSGEYTQGEGRLRRNDKHCCLGVLCELAVVEGIIEKPGLDRLGRETYLYGLQADDSNLPKAVSYWANLSSRDGLLPVEIKTGTKIGNTGRITQGSIGSLMTMNDSGFTFLEIADVIEEQF